MPEYLEQQGALKEAGVDEVIVYCVNDGAVMMGCAPLSASLCRSSLRTSNLAQM